jgi:transglutaminase-like putative cysteine protease
MIARLSRRILSAEVLGLILVLLALQIFIYGISSSLRGTDTQYLFRVSLIGAVIGYGLNRRRWNGFTAAAGITALGILGIWILSARLMLPLFDLVISIAQLVPQIIPAIREQIPIDTSAVLEGWAAITQASSALAARWQTWLIGVNKTVTVNDALIRSMIWILVIWCLAAWTGWFTARRSAVHALLPGLAVLAAVLSYSEYRVVTVWLMVFILMLLMGIWNYKNHTMQWERRRVDYSDSILYDNAQAVLFLAISVGVIAFITPSISWRDIRDYFRERNSNEAAEMLGIREQVVSAQNVTIQRPSLPREHLLTEGFAQSQKLVMTIRTGELPPVVNPSFAEEAPRHYWRSTVYDEYMGAGWVTSAAVPQSFRANTPLVPGLLDGYRLLHMDVKIQQPEGKLFWSGVLYSADVQFRANWRVRPQTSLFADQTALLRGDIFAAATSATAYQAASYIPLVTVEDLRRASTDYPDEIITRYLKLPRDLPERVHQLAAEITDEKSNPYDRAKAIESYLRTNYPYDLDVPAPPQDQDVADYFLFDLKRGYCDYYATAMVVLARSSGLPARFVSGYSPGSYDAPNAQYVVRELNAHSWVEVYFPEIGWIEFEPTASQPEIERVETQAEIPTSNEPASPAEKFLIQLTRTRILYWLAPFTIALFLVILYFSFIERLWILSLAPSNAVSWIYRRYYRMGRPLAGPRTRAETASEFTDNLTRSIEAIRVRSEPAKASKQFKGEAQQLTHIYLLSLFSSHSTSKHDARKSFDLWKRLRRQLLIARLQSFLVRIKMRLVRRHDTQRAAEQM